MKLKSVSKEDAPVVSELIKKSNIPVAELLNLTKDNCPKHPSNCEPEWIIDDLNRGVEYFLLYIDDEPVGTIAYETPDNQISYLNRLAVIPQFQGKGFGKYLVDYHLNYSREKGISTVSIGIINENKTLKGWYEKIGFKEGSIKEFPHLPFTVSLMTYHL